MAMTGFCFCGRAQSNSLFSKLRTFQSMSERWELDTPYKRSTFLISPYKPVYITAGRRSNNPNEQPTSENPLYSLPFKVPYNNNEAKFQLSFKSKIVQGLIKGHGDLWIAFTQKAHWQLYNKALSRPFRELNYEPEVILDFATRIPLAGFTTRMLGVSINHQSNGRIFPLSRSWNRIIFIAGFERKNWQIFLRPWIRLPDEEDENPAITDYTGRGEAVVIRNLGKHQLSAVATHSLRTGKKSRGSIQGNWVFPVWKNLKAMLQITDGYGETLQDYNHRQTTFGVSVSLMEW
jgi:phospholipase A1